MNIHYLYSPFCYLYARTLEEVIFILFLLFDEIVVITFEIEIWLVCAGILYVGSLDDLLTAVEGIPCVLLDHVEVRASTVMWVTVDD